MLYINKQVSDSIKLLYRYYFKWLINKYFHKNNIILNFQDSRRGPSNLCGRTDGNIKVIIPNIKLSVNGSSLNQDIKPGDYIAVKVGSINNFA